MTSTKELFKARMEQTPEGLFRASYADVLSRAADDEPAPPDAYVGASESDVRAWVEAMAKRLGYSGVSWQ